MSTSAEAVTLDNTRSGISAIICTFNGGQRIEGVLKALASCEAAGPTEIVLVDNNSTDGVAGIAERFWQQYGKPEFSFRIVHETQQGLSHARKAGATAASYEVLVFVDDDNILAPDYLLRAFQLMKDKSVAAIGGAGVPVFERPPPPHVYNFITWLACGIQTSDDLNLEDEVIELTKHPSKGLYGAGLILRRSALLSLFATPDFPLLTDRAANLLTSGGDIEISHALAVAGGRLLSCPDLTFEHLIPEGRFSKEYFIRLRREGRQSETILGLYATVRELKGDPAALFRPRNMLKAMLALVGLSQDRRALFKWLCFLGATFAMRPSEHSVWRITRALPSCNNRGRLDATVSGDPA